MGQEQAGQLLRNFWWENVWNILSADDIICISRSCIKTSTGSAEAETTQVILAQLQHALDRACDGSRRNDARRTESLGNACVTLNW